MYFNPRSPRGGATALYFSFCAERCISIHAPHEGERRHCITIYTASKSFQSTLPTRGSDSGGGTFSSIPAGFQSTLPTRGSDHAKWLRGEDGGISIHAPHEGERRIDSAQSWHEMIISIHAPHEGERRAATAITADDMIISIHAPHEGERPAYNPIDNVVRHFNPRSPRGGAT